MSKYFKIFKAVKFLELPWYFNLFLVFLNLPDSYYSEDIISEIECKKLACYVFLNPSFQLDVKDHNSKLKINQYIIDLRTTIII